MKIEDKIGKDWFKRGYQKGYRAGKLAHITAMKKAMEIKKEQTGLSPIITKAETLDWDKEEKAKEPWQ